MNELACLPSHYVYFVMSGKIIKGRDPVVKIGTTSNIVLRMNYWSGYYLLGVTWGHYSREAEIHYGFRHIQAGSEWFTLCDELIWWILQNTDQNVPEECWKYVKRFDRTIFDDLIEAQYTPFVELTNPRRV